MCVCVHTYLLKSSFTGTFAQCFNNIYCFSSPSPFQYPRVWVRDRHVSPTCIMLWCQNSLPKFCKFLCHAFIVILKFGLPNCEPIFGFAFPFSIVNYCYSCEIDFDLFFSYCLACYHITPHLLVRGSILVSGGLAT